VPVPIFIVSVKTGGLLLGAFEPCGDGGERLVGFAYSLPGFTGGRAFHWSHMLGVVDRHRDSGLGWQLKAEQRRRVLESGLDLVRWTYDPLQALNARFNFVKLGAVVDQYHPDVYGESSSPLHCGTATDRFIAEWWLRSPKVEERLAAVERGAAVSPDGARAVAVNAVGDGGVWIAPTSHDLSVGEPRVAVVIPTGFTEMQQQAPSLARDWRAATREIFSHYLGGYQVIDFVLERPERRGRYILQRR